MDLIDNRFRVTQVLSILGDADCKAPEHAHRYVGGELVPGCQEPHCAACGAAMGWTSCPGCGHGTEE